jgi:transposase
VSISGIDRQNKNPWCGSTRDLHRQKSRKPEFIRKAHGFIRKAHGDDMQGILLIEYVHTRKKALQRQEKSIRTKETIRKLKTAMRQKKTPNCHQKIMLLHDNCRVHKSRQVLEVIDECGSPGLAPSDYYLFPKLKKHLRRLRFSSDESLKGAVEDLSKEFCRMRFSGHDECSEEC